MRVEVKWTDIAIVFLTVGIVFFALMQWLEMRGAGKQTDQLVAYAQAQAKAAGDIAQASNDFTDSAKLMEEYVQSAAKAMKDNAATADKSLRDTEQSIRNAQIAFRDDQRAWLGAVGTSMEGIEIDAIPIARVTWFNSGKTFAKHVDPSVHLRFAQAMMNTEEELYKAANTGVNSVPETSIGV